MEEYVIILKPSIYYLNGITDRVKIPKQHSMKINQFYKLIFVSWTDKLTISTIRQIWLWYQQYWWALTGPVTTHCWALSDHSLAHARLPNSIVCLVYWSIDAYHKWWNFKLMKLFWKAKVAQGTIWNNKRKILNRKKSHRILVEIGRVLHRSFGRVDRAGREAAASERCVHIRKTKKSRAGRRLKYSGNDEGAIVLRCGPRWNSSFWSWKQI